jgi:VWFA-related protein
MWRCRRRLVSSAIAAFALASSVVVTQEQRDPRFNAATSAITVDVVVRDQRGRPVTDLGRADFQLFEDKVPQEIRDVALVAGASQVEQQNDDKGGVRSGSAASPGNQPFAPGAGPTFVALVFDRLSPEARALAHRGALTYLDTNRPQDFAGVFLSDLSLITVQTYTTDRARLRTAIDDVATGRCGARARRRWFERELAGDNGSERRRVAQGSADQPDDAGRADRGLPR